MYFSRSSVVFKGNCVVLFYYNKASYGGATKYADSIIMLYDNSTMRFSGNKANKVGGAMFWSKCNITFKGQSVITYSSNY